MEKLAFNLDDLYRTLKKHDVDILAHYNDLTISDNNYFYYAINNEIMSNALNIVTNMQSNNIESIGVDISCRAIIETLTIIRMCEMGKISENQKKIFRYLYSFVDLDNYKSLINENDKDSIVYKNIIEDRKKANDAIKEQFNKKVNYRIDDPCFYLKQNENDNISFSKLIKEYLEPYCKGIDMIYEFFSLFIHPRCETRENLNDYMQIIRKEYIRLILDIIVEYLKNNKLIILDNSLPTFKQDFYDNPLLSNNVNNIEQVKIAFYLLKKRMCTLPNGTDMPTYFMLENVEHMFIDMLMSISLGYREHVISVYKSFVEYFSIYYKINTCNVDEFRLLNKTYRLSSSIQLYLQISKLGISDSNIKVFEKELKEYYDSYYKNKYNVNDFDSFFNEFCMNSLYFLSNETKSYNKFVKEMMSELLKEKYDDAFSLYKLSKDIGHASGFGFNCTDSIVNISSFKVIVYAHELLLNWIIMSSITLAEHNIDIDIKNIVDMFISSRDVYMDELNKQIVIARKDVDEMIKNVK